MKSDKILSLHRKDVRLETGFSLALFSKARNAELAERGPHSTGSMSTTVKTRTSFWGTACVKVRSFKVCRVMTLLGLYCHCKLDDFDFVSKSQVVRNITFGEEKKILFTAV